MLVDLRGARRDMELVNLMDSWGSCVDVWDSQLEQTLGTIKGAQQTWNLQIRGVATDAGHHKTRAKDVELANPRGNAWETRNLRFLWIPGGPRRHGTCDSARKTWNPHAKI